MSDENKNTEVNTAEAPLPEQLRRVQRELARLLADPRVSLQEKQELRSDPLFQLLHLGGQHDS
ncbi:MAG: hypothetical protein EBZ48_02330 [Proteobacteria bacterium]|nr:hypothetical protein [Pseudomonadota bacterium]